MVVAGHLRAFLFDSYIPDNNLSSAAFYCFTGFSGQAVIIFFSLSGFLVGGKTFLDLKKRNFNWAFYMLRRLTRLWVVVIPALILTLGFDLIGERFASHIYDGAAHHIYGSGPKLGVGIDESFSTFVGNVLFLQTIAVPVFGSNGPMWSLANEFWYYVFCPLSLWLVTGAAKSRSSFAMGAIALATLAMLLPTSFIEGGVIWAAGASAAAASRSPLLRSVFLSGPAKASALLLIPTALALSKSGLIGNLGLGLIVAASLAPLSHLRSFGKMYEMISRGISEISYTLYLMHFPFLMLLIAIGWAPNRFDSVHQTALLTYTTLLSLTIGWAVVLWWLFERRTDQLYVYIKTAMEARLEYKRT